MKSLFEKTRGIPIALPWSRSEWNSLRIEESLEDWRFEAFFEAWQNHASQGDRAKAYVAIAMVNAVRPQGSAHATVSSQEFQDIVAAKVPAVPLEVIDTMLAASQRISLNQTFFPGPGELFEFLSVVARFCDAELARRIRAAGFAKVQERNGNVAKVAYGFGILAINAHFEESANVTKAPIERRRIRNTRG